LRRAGKRYSSLAIPLLNSVFFLFKKNLAADFLDHQISLTSLL
jgi:hypothetical protein